MVLEEIDTRRPGEFLALLVDQVLAHSTVIWKGSRAASSSARRSTHRLFERYSTHSRWTSVSSGMGVPAGARPYSTPSRVTRACSRLVVTVVLGIPSGISSTGITGSMDAASGCTADSSELPLIIQNPTSPNNMTPAPARRRGSAGLLGLRSNSRSTTGMLSSSRANSSGERPDSTHLPGPRSSSRSERVPTSTFRLQSDSSSSAASSSLESPSASIGTGGGLGSSA